jgi:hypothetical protein
VAVWGDGVIGQLAAQAALDRGMRVWVVGHRKDRLDAAAALGLKTINSHDDDWSASLLSSAGGKLGAVIDTIQYREVQLDYLPLLRREPYPQVVFSGFTTGDGFVQDGHLQGVEASVDFVCRIRRDRMEATIASFVDGKPRLCLGCIPSSLSGGCPGHVRAGLSRRTTDTWAWSLTGEGERSWRKLPRPLRGLLHTFRSQVTRRPPRERGLTCSSSHSRHPITAGTPTRTCDPHLARVIPESATIDHDLVLRLSF